MSGQFLSAAASLALLGAWLVSAEGTRSEAVLPAKPTSDVSQSVIATPKCRVEVVRSGAPGTADITHLSEPGGGCICVVTTGPIQGNAEAEELVGSLLRNRSCDGAPPPNPSPAAFAPGPSLLPLIAAPIGAAGAAATTAGGNDSPG